MFLLEICVCIYALGVQKFLQPFYHIFLTFSTKYTPCISWPKCCSKFSSTFPSLDKCGHCYKCFQKMSIFLNNFSKIFALQFLLKFIHSFKLTLLKFTLKNSSRFFLLNYSNCNYHFYIQNIERL